MKTALIFPGQGNQEIGMGYALASKYPACMSFFDAAQNILSFDLRPLIWQPNPAFERTDIIQLALFTVSCAMLELFDQQHDMVAGHSLGEFAALYASKAITFEQGLNIIQKRGSAMNKACQSINSKMLAVLGVGDIEKLAKTTGCEIANYNSSTQNVLSGLTDQIEQAQQLATTEYGFTHALLLNTAGAYHSSWMKSALNEFASELSAFAFSKPNVPVIANCSARPIVDIKQNMVDQIHSPVLWKQSIDYMSKQGIECFIEIGHGNVLTKMLTRDGYKCSKFNPTTNLN